MEEIRYCIFCGSPLSGDSRCCPACKKEIPLKENLFKEYLYRNTKESLKEKADDTLFNIVKNWLISHLYGLVVSIMFVGLAAVALVSPRTPGYIVNMNSSSRPGEQSNIPASQTEETNGNRLSSEDFTEISDLRRQFTQSVFYNIFYGDGESVPGDPRFEDGPPLPPEAYYIPKEYDKYPVSSNFFYETGYHSIRGDEGDWIGVNEPTTEIGKMLYADGFMVVEEERIYTYRKSDDENAPADKTDRFLFVFVKMDGQWYIAETKLIGQEG